MRWLRHLRPDRDSRRIPLAEPMEPRLLYSADLTGGLMLADAASTTAAPEVRTVTDTGEYATTATTAANAATSTAAATYASTSLAFEANDAGTGVDFSAYGSGYGIALAGGNAQLTLPTAQGTQTVTLALQGANTATAQGEDLQAGTSNVIVGSDASQWRTGIANYGAVRYANVYGGVDLRYYGTQSQLEYDFIVAAGADASVIRLQFPGASGVTVDANGNLVLQVAGTDSSITFKAPVAYQRGADGQLQAVASSYAMQADGSIGFTLGDYDHSRQLVIDPVLDYATYFGDSGAETGIAIATDASGNVYVTGRTTTTSATTGPFAGGTGGGAGDIFVAKFSSDLSTLLWSTRIGGSNDEQGNAIAVDANGNVAVTGWTKSGNFPTLNAAQASLNGGQDAVIFKLDTNGALVFSTYLGGTGATDSGNAVAFDGAGNVYAAGEESSTGLLSTVLQLVFGSSDNAFVNKYDGTGALTWSQTLGGSSTDLATGIAVGASGDVYVVGTTNSSNMSIVGGAQTALSGGQDGFLVHLDATGNTVLYSTYVGGSDADSVAGVAIDGSGKAYLVGETLFKNNGTFTVTTGAFQPASNVGNNNNTGFLRVYDTTLTGAASLVYSSYLGGSATDTPTGVAYADGRMVVVGRAGSGNFPVTADAAQSSNPGTSMFMVVLDPVGNGASDLQYGSYYGGNMTAGGVAISGNTAYFVGSTSATGYATGGVYQVSKSGSTDALIVAISVFTNTAPTLSGVVQPPAILEDSGGGSGFLVSSLLAGKVTDPDTGALQGIAIVGSDNSNGTWQYSQDNGTTWIAVGTTSATSALLLAADSQTRLRFLPGANYAGTVAAGLTIRAWDRTSGTAGSRVDASMTGGLTAFSSASFGVDQVVTGVNDPPVLTAGTVADAATYENITVDLGLAGLQYGPGGGADEAGQALTITVTVVPPASLGTVVLANGTVVTANTVYALSDLQGMKFRPTPDATGAGVFSWTVTDNGGTANGGNDTLAESLNVTVAPVNEAPELAAGAVNNLTVVEGSPATSLGLAGLAYNPGVGTDEAWQTLNYQVTGVPAGTVGRIVLADGTTTVVAGNSYTLAQIQGMQFLAASVASGSGVFSFTVQDNGGTAYGGSDTLVQSLTVTIVNQAPALDGLNAMALLEDPATNNGVLVSDLVAGHISDPLNAQGIAVTGATDPNGTWQYSVDGGSTWAAIAGVSNSQALLLAADTLTRVRFVPQADWNGTASSLAVRAWDQSAGTAGQFADTTANGGSSAFSSQVQTASVTVTPVNDAPELVTGNVANLTVRAGTTTSLGFSDLTYDPGGGADEVGQVLTYTVTATPPATLGTLLLADGTTAVVAGTSYTLAQLQGMQFAPLTGVTSGSANFAFTVRDNGGTANGGSDTLAQSLTITVANQAPILSGANPLPTLAEDPATNDGALVADLVSGQITDPGGIHGIAVIGASNPNGQWQYSLDNGATWQAFTGVGTTSATLLAGDGQDRVRFVPNADWNGTAGGLVFRAWDGSGGTAGSATGDTTVVGGSSPYSAQSAEAMVTVLPVNDAPVRTAGTVSDLAVLEDSGSTSLGLGALAYGPGGGADEAGQLLTYTVTALPPAALGQVTLADGTLVATGSYTLAQVQGMRFVTAANANGAGTFTFQVQDNGGTANGGVDTLVQSLQLTVTPVNDPPVRTAGSAANLAVNEDSGSTSLGLGGLAYGNGGGSDEAGQVLTYTVTTLPPASLGQITLADGTIVATGSYTLAQIQGMRFQTAADANGSGTFAFTVQDDGGTANGGSDTLAEALQITVNAVNDPPVLLAGAVSNLSVIEGSPATSLGLAGLSYGPGGGADEAGQVLGFQVTAVPAGAVGRIVLADGATTVVAGGSYTLAQIQGMQFLAGSMSSGSGTFSFTVQDNGGTANGGVDTLVQSLTVTIVNAAPTLDGVNSMTLQEDPASNNGVLVADLVSGHDGDPLGVEGVAIVGAMDPNGSWQYSLDGGGTWTAVTGVGNTHALLLGADGSTRLRFVPAPDFAGNAGGLMVRAWDQSSGAAGGYADTTVSGGSSAFSTQVQTADVTVTPVNDAPVLVFGALNNLTVDEGSTTSLGLTGLSYGPGGGADETGQMLTYTVTVVPPAAFGTIQLADGTVVAAGISYTIAEIEGMKFAVAAGVTSGSASFSFNVQDDGGTANGGVDTLVQGLTLTVRNDAPVLSGANPLPAITEDPTSNTGMLVADLVSGQVSDPGGTYGIAVISASQPNGTWQYSVDNGATWQAFSGVGTTTATLLAADAQDRVRFVPDADWNGIAGGLVFRAWDGSGGTAGATTGDTTTTGGSSPYSAQTAEAQVTVLAVNDAPVLTAGSVAGLTVAEDSGSTSLGLAGLGYGPGGGADEAAQTLSIQVTALPPATLGAITLADGTAVTAGTYTLAQLQGMRFVTVADANGTGTFSFTVQDSGGTANGGVDSLAQGMQVIVTPAPPVVVAPAAPAPAPAPAAEPPLDPGVIPPVVAAPAPSPAPASAPAAAPAVSAGPATQGSGAAAVPSAGNDTRGARAGETLQEALGPTMPTAIATFNNTEISFTSAPARVVLDTDTSRVLHTVVFDRGGLELISADPDAQLVLARFGIDSRPDARLDDFQRTLHSTAFSNQLDHLREAVREDLDLDQSVAVSVVSVSLGLSLVYVLWLIRGGVLLGSYLSALPAWRMLDPLPVLSRVEDEEDDEEPLEGGRRDGRDTLRGFG
jgi:hypothetical protein